MFLHPAEYCLSDFWERKTSICKQQGASHESSKAGAASRPASYIKDLNIWQSAIMKQLRKGSEAWLKLYRINKTCGAPLQRDVRKIYSKGSLLTTQPQTPSWETNCISRNLSSFLWFWVFVFIIAFFGLFIFRKVEALLVYQVELN